VLFKFWALRGQTKPISCDFAQSEDKKYETQDQFSDVPRSPLAGKPTATHNNLDKTLAKKPMLAHKRSNENIVSTWPRDFPQVWNEMRSVWPPASKN